MKKKHILLIDDDQKLCSLLSRFLKERNYSVRAVYDGESGISFAKTDHPDLILLDVMLPGKDGFEILKELRKFLNVPVIMLTARGDVTDRVLGLELGADDYIPKPFEPAEMEARIKAVLRRANPENNEDLQEEQFDSFRVHPAKKCIVIEKKEIELSVLEYRLLSYFIANRNISISRDQITEALHGEEFDSFNRSVDVLVSRLRKKLNDNPKNPNIIKTLHGHGYIFIA